MLDLAKTPLVGGSGHSSPHYAYTTYSRNKCCSYYPQPTWAESRAELPAAAADFCTLNWDFSSLLVNLMLGRLVLDRTGLACKVIRAANDVFFGIGVYTVIETFFLAGLSPFLTEAELFDCPSRVARFHAGYIARMINFSKTAGKQKFARASEGSDPAGRYKTRSKSAHYTRSGTPLYFFSDWESSDSKSRSSTSQSNGYDSEEDEEEASVFEYEANHGIGAVLKFPQPTAIANTISVIYHPAKNADMPQDWPDLCDAITKHLESKFS
ncbi:hypothetical protein R3P38DRAFT_2793079 [Favolaschia claudopus]|uniref:Uncharacterized protein n=1 Tax=Favolaschia claudopus TaxID=2862362 RepID=A0AAW0AEL7_9AGAR